MSAAGTQTPDLSTLDTDALKDLVLSLQAQLQSRNTEIENLKLLILKLKRLQFGRKSEKRDRQIEQLELQLEDLEATQAEAAPAEGPVRGPASCRKRGHRPPRAPQACFTRNSAICSGGNAQLARLPWIASQ